MSETLPKPFVPEQHKPKSEKDKGLNDLAWRPMSVPMSVLRAGIASRNNAEKSTDSETKSGKEDANALDRLTPEGKRQLLHLFQTVEKVRADIKQNPERASLYIPYLLELERLFIHKEPSSSITQETEPSLPALQLSEQEPHQTPQEPTPQPTPEQAPPSDEQPPVQEEQAPEPEEAPVVTEPSTQPEAPEQQEESSRFGEMFNLGDVSAALPNPLKEQSTPTSPAERSEAPKAGQVQPDQERGLDNETEHARSKEVEPSSDDAAVDIFRRTYRIFAEDAKEGISRRGKEEVATDFVGSRMDAARSRIIPLEQKAGLVDGPSLMSAIDRTAANQYDDEDARKERILRAEKLVDGFIGRAEALIQNGEVDELTAKTFFRRMAGFRHGLSMGYNSVVSKSDETMPSLQEQNDYAKKAHEAIQEIRDRRAGEDEYFAHVNLFKYKGSGESVSERFYISPKLNGDPGKVIEEWVKAAEAEGGIYYKFSQKLARRYDNLVVYVTPDTEEAAKRAIETFSRQCPEELLSDTPMPSVVPVEKGIGRGPEPDALNDLLRYQGEGIVSYNLLVTALTELSLQRAAADYLKRGVAADAINPSELASTSERYFEQFIKLSGIDPQTMKPQSLTS